MHTKKIYINSNYVDSNFELKMSSFFQMMQEIAGEHCEILGVGHSETIEKGKIWVITRFQVEVNEMPKYRQNVILKTYPGKTAKFIFPRHFILCDENDNTLIKASSTFLVISSDTRQIIMNPFENNDLPYETYEGELGIPEKVNVTEVEFIEKRIVRYSDIDLNSHLNNTRYIEYIFDLHDSEFYKNHVIKSLIINYKHEAKNKDEISLYSNKNNPEIIVGKINDTSIFDVSLSYKER